MNNDKEHAEMLAEYFTTLFGPDERVHIFPMLAGGKDNFMAHIDDIDEFVGGKRVKYWGYDWDDKNPETNQVQKWMPIIVTKPFCRKASSKSVKIIPHLRELSDVGYDIFFCINPLSCSTRCTQTVRKVSHILLECDNPDISITTQRETLMKYKDVFSAITFSGNKSLHAILQIVPPLWNPHCLNWEQIRYMGPRKKAPEWNEPQRIAQYWIDTLLTDKLPVDIGAANDYTRLSRVPGFPHSKTGKIAQIEYLNPNASYSTRILASEGDWDNDFGANYDNERKTIYLVNSDTNSPNANVTVNVNINSDININIDNINHISLSKDNSITQNPDIRGDRRGREKKREREGPTKTDVMHICLSEGIEVTFLDEIRHYEKLKMNGIESRYIRRTLHPIIYRVANILGWTEYEMIGEWRDIVSINPNNINCTVDVAVYEFMECYRKGKPSGYYLPDCTRLPQLNDFHMKALRKRLKAEGCPRVTGACNIIENVLWESIRELPAKCVDGNLGISSRELQAACRRYKEPFGWMIDRNIIRVTNPSYSAGRATRKYRVNIPLLLYWLGFRNEELAWNLAAGGMLWDELAA